MFQVVPRSHLHMASLQGASRVCQKLSQDCDECARTGTSPHCQQSITAALLAVVPCAFAFFTHSSPREPLPGCDTEKGKGTKTCLKPISENNKHVPPVQVFLVSNIEGFPDAGLDGRQSTISELHFYSLFWGLLRWCIDGMFYRFLYFVDVHKKEDCAVPDIKD